MKICLIDAGAFADKPELLDPLRELGQVEIFTGIPGSLEEVVRRAKGADVVAFGISTLSNEMLDCLPNLKILQFIGTGVWNFVDVKYAESKGIRVLNIDGYGSNAVAEFAVSMAMVLAKKITITNALLRNGLWEEGQLKCLEISGATVGVLGTGSIGRLVAEKFVALGATVIASDLYENDSLKKDFAVRYVPTEELFRRSDIVTLHMKVTDENTKMINKNFFALMKEGALFVNVARAELVDNSDLYDALKNGKIGGAAVDVYYSEPPSASDYELINLENVIATPHIAFYTQRANDNSLIMMAESIVKCWKEIL